MFLHFFSFLVSYLLCCQQQQHTLIFKIVTSHLLFTSLLSRICEKGSVCSSAMTVSNRMDKFTCKFQTQRRKTCFRRGRNFILWLLLDRWRHTHATRREEGKWVRKQGKNCRSRVYLSANFWGRTENLWFPSSSSLLPLWALRAWPVTSSPRVRVCVWVWVRKSDAMVGVKFPSCTEKGWECTLFLHNLSVLKEKPQTERMKALCVCMCVCVVVWVRVS